MLAWRSATLDPPVPGAAEPDAAGTTSSAPQRSEPTTDCVNLRPRYEGREGTQLERVKTPATVQEPLGRRQGSRRLPTVAGWAQAGAVSEDAEAVDGDAGTIDWHRPLRHTPAGALSSDTAQSGGMQRREAISGRRSGSEELWMGEAVVAAGARSSDHHHGRSETGIYVVAGSPVFVFAEGGAERRVETRPGDYVFVPPWVPHREENPGPEPAVVVLARTTQEAVVVNLPGLVPPG